MSIKVGDTAVSAAQDRGHDALALQIARYISKKIARYISKKIARYISKKIARYISKRNS